MHTHQALTFVERIAGFELCTGAGEDGSAQYRVSPVARAFLEGAIGSHLVPEHAFASNVEQLKAMGTFFQSCGIALLEEAKLMEERQVKRTR